MSEKTEQPTSKKLRQAREEGQVAHSKDFTQTVVILALFGYILANAENIIRDLSQMILLPTNVMGMAFEDAVNAVATQLLRESIALLVPFLLIVLGLGLFIELAQTGMNFAFKAMMPSAKKLNVISNIKNIFSIKNVVEFLKNNLKIAILTAIIWKILADSLPAMMTLPEAGITGVGIAIATLLKSMTINVAVGYVVIAIADIAWQRHQHVKGLMMSKDEVKQEYKEAEGDPHIKHQRKHLHMEMMQEGAVHATKKASVVVTNPTHLAIAIQYDKDKTPLPVVLAKGEGYLARRMVQAAEEAGIPVLQNIPLAHALMDTAALDQYIPSELVEPVAEVLRLVGRMKQEE
jgi:type III secretion protein U